MAETEEEIGEGTETGREEGRGIEKEKEGVIAAVEEMEMGEITMITDRREMETGDSTITTTTTTVTTTIVKKVSAIHHLCSPSNLI